MANLIKLIPVEELRGKKFNIPSYQRGYKWTKKQAEDLLEDLDEFKTNVENNSNPDSFYCLQPLAVAPRLNEEYEDFDIKKYKTEQEAIEEIQKLFNKRIVWDVIDGQQRLTTIYPICTMYSLFGMPKI